MFIAIRFTILFYVLSHKMLYSAWSPRGGVHEANSLVEIHATEV